MLVKEEKEMVYKIANHLLLSDKKLSIGERSEEARALLRMNKPDRLYLREGIALLRHYGLEEARNIWN